VTCLDVPTIQFPSTSVTPRAVRSILPSRAGALELARVPYVYSVTIVSPGEGVPRSGTVTVRSRWFES
jgi:hypothetical protein